MREAKESAKNRANRIGATGLDAGEMVDDALARGFSATVKWIKRNRRLIEIGVLAAIVLGAGYATWDWYSMKQKEKASAELMAAVANALGVVEEKSSETEAKPQTSNDDDKRFEIRPRFESYQAMQQEALRTYRVAVDGQGTSGIGTLAKLGEAGVLLDSQKYDEAIELLQQVLGSALSKVDDFIKMAAKERLAMAYEGKGDGAQADSTYAELANSSIKSYKDLGLYHQLRRTIEKGDKEEAKQKLGALKNRIVGKDNDPMSPEVTNRFMIAQLDSWQRELDPAGAPIIPRTTSQLTPEQLQRLQKQMEELQRRALETPPPPPVDLPPPQPSSSNEAPDSAVAPDTKAPIVPSAPVTADPSGINAPKNSPQNPSESP